MISRPLIIGIDASNIRSGGGVTHLVELLRAAQPEKYGIDRIVVWGGAPTLDALEERPWLAKRHQVALDEGLIQRTLWQRFRLSHFARHEGCSVLFVPGGSYAGDFQCLVVMSQNLLPFEMPELMRYGWSMSTIKFLLLRLTQSHSFKKANGVIFLTEFARTAVLLVTGQIHGKTCIIPHGLNFRFNTAPKPQHAISDYDEANPYRVLYVSSIDQYKHQWHVVTAVDTLRKMGLPIVLDLVGSAYPPALKRLNSTIDQVDEERHWIHYHGAIPYAELHEMYAAADVGIWASTCETFGIILLEAMASGLPIACSGKQPMPEVIGGSCVYFNPELPEDISRALLELIDSPDLRMELAQASYRRAQQYSWTRCADETLEFLLKVLHQYEIDHR